MKRKLTTRQMIEYEKYREKVLNTPLPGEEKKKFFKRHKRNKK